MKIIPKIFLSAGVLALLYTNLFAFDYYWVSDDSNGSNNPSGTEGKNWTKTNESGAEKYSGTITFTDQDNLYYGNYTSALSTNYYMSGFYVQTLNLNSITNERTAAASVDRWDLFAAYAGATTWNIAGNITQNSAIANTHIRNSGGAKGNLNVKVAGNVDVLKRILNFGGDATAQYINSLEVTGKTSITGNATSGQQGTLYFYGSTASFNGGTELTGVNAILSSFATSSTNFKGLTSLSGSGARIIINPNSTGTSTASFESVSVTEGAYLLLGVNIADFPRNPNGKVTFSATDLTYNTPVITSWNTKSFTVKADETVAGSTGTFSWSSANAGQNGRLRLLTDNMEVDNLIVGLSTDTVASYFEVARGSDQSPEFAGVGTLKFGSITTNGASQLRLGYLHVDNVANPSLNPRTRYANINIGTLDAHATAVTPANAMELYADNVTIDKLTKHDGSGDILIGFGNSTEIMYRDLGAKTIVIGKDATSVNSIESGSLKLAALNSLTFNGKLTIGTAAGGKTANIYLQSPVNADGDYNIGTVYFDTIEVLSGTGITSDIQNKLTISKGSTITAAPNVTIDNIIYNRYANLFLGAGSDRLGDVLVKNLTVASTADGDSNGIEINARDTSALLDPSAANYYSAHIENFNQSGTVVARVYLRQNSKLDNVTFASANSSSAIFATGHDLLVDKIDYSSKGTVRFGGPSTEMVRKFTANTINFKSPSSGVSALFTINATNAVLKDINIDALANFYVNGKSTITNITALDNLSSASTLSYLKFSDDVTMSGKFTIGSATKASYVAITMENSKSFTSTGILEMGTNSGFYLNYGVAAANTLNYAFAGINGGSGDQTTRLFTDGTKANLTITFNGSGEYSYNSRIHDFGGAIGKTDPMPTSGIISLVKNGTGVQKLRGQNYWRGDTTINSGELHVRTNILDNTKNLGLAKVLLKGGKLSAIGSTSEAGTLVATELVWDASGSIIVDIIGAQKDLISLGTLTKGTGTGFTFEFNLDSVILAQEYQIVGFNSTDFTSASEFLADIDNPLYQASFRFDNASGIYVTFAAIPEPSAYAAVLGLIALFFAIRRRRK